MYFLPCESVLNARNDSAVKTDEEQGVWLTAGAVRNQIMASEPLPLVHGTFWFMRVVKSGFPKSLKRLLDYANAVNFTVSRCSLCW